MRFALNRLRVLTFFSLIWWVAWPDGRLEGCALSDLPRPANGASTAAAAWEPAPVSAAFPALLLVSGAEENPLPRLSLSNRDGGETNRSGEADVAAGKLDFLFYRGQMVSNDFRNIVFNQKRDYVPSFIRVAAVNYKLGDFYGPFTWEFEGQFAKHNGLQNHSEMNALLIARWEIRWKDNLSFSWAVGDGLSVASEVPRTEKDENPSSGAAANYMMTEIDLGLPFLAFHPRLMFRIHHRSGVFGVFCRGTCGSNILTFGLKFAR